MSHFLKIEFEFLSDVQKDIIIALLGAANYEGFEEEGDLLKAYIPSELYDEHELKNVISGQELAYTISRIENENWNELWESNFSPIIVDHPVSGIPWVSIRAEFHEPNKTVEHDIIITPKMSFGTGHHPTTLMMIQMMGELDIRDKTVMDFGTGSGILAILAEKLGASRVTAIDIDPQSIRNATENYQSNKCTHIDIRQESSARGRGQYDIILANITKNVIVENLPAFVEQLADDGILLLSGILQEDEATMVKGAEKYRLITTKKCAFEQWLAFKLTPAHNNI